jgi:sugar phosphate isomerase/epimerase
LKRAAALPLVAGTTAVSVARLAPPAPGTPHLKLSCNLFSFNEPLRSGAMSLEAVIAFCADQGFDAVDPTGYYFPGYPDVPDRAYVYRIKQQAFLSGLAISGTGVRNDFTVADPAARAADVALIKQWVAVAADLDAPVLRVFASPSGYELPPGHTRDDVTGWVVDGLRECGDYGAEHGVMIVLQNHDSFLKTAAEVLDIRERIESDWFGLNVDIGSLRTGDPYEEVALLAPNAYTWQLKELVYRNEVEEKTDVKKVIAIINDAGYRGYIPIETLGEGDPKEKVPRFLDEVRAALV